MAKLNFPSSPTNGTEYTPTGGSRTWVYNGIRWVLKNNGFKADPGVPNAANVSTTGYAFGGDGDTGLFSPIMGGGATNGTLGLFTNNQERIRVASNGRIGIGTLNPTTVLTISADTPVITLKDNSVGLSAVGYIKIEDSTGEIGLMGFDSTTDNDLTIKNKQKGGIDLLTNSSTKMFITSGGNVGIGTKTPSERLTIIGNISATGEVLAQNLVAAMPVDTSIDVSRVGFLNDYLQLDIKASFAGPAVTQQHALYAFKELNGSLVGLRPGTDGSFQSVYYFYAPTTKITSKNIFVTDIEYKAPWMPAGARAHRILGSANQQGFCLLTQGGTATRQVFWVSTNGSMDPRVHTAKEITAIVQHNDDRITYCETLDGTFKIFIRSRDNANGFITDNLDKGNTYDLTFQFFDASQNLNTSPPPPAMAEFNFGRFDLGPTSSIINFGSYNGDTIDAVYFNHSSQGELRAVAISNTEILVARPSEMIILNYGTTRYPNEPVCFNSVVKFTANTSTASRYHPLPGGGKYIFNPSLNPEDWSPPFYLRGNYYDGKKQLANKRGQMILLDVGGGEVIELSKGGESSNTTFYVSRHEYNAGKTYKDLITDPYNASKIATEITHDLTISPYDSSLIGKRLRGYMWVSDTKLLVRAESRVYPATSTTAASILVDLPSSTTTETWRGSISGLKTPSAVTDTENTFPLSAANLNHQIFVSSASLNTITLYNRSGEVFRSIDPLAGTITNPNLKTLPSDWSTQIDNIINARLADVSLVASNFVTAKNLYYITGNLFLLAFNATNKPGTSSKSISYCCLVKLTSPSVLAFVAGSLKKLMDETQYNGTNFVGVNMGPLWNVCSIYQHSTTEWYALFTCHGGSVGGTGNAFVGAVKIDPSTESIISFRQTSKTGPSWSDFTPGIHPRYGAYITNAENGYMWIKQSHFPTTTINLNATQMKDTFEKWLTGTPATTEPNQQTLYVISTRAVVGYVLYSSQSPVFIKGKETKLSTNDWPMIDSKNWIATKPSSLSSKTFYVYIVLETLEGIEEAVLKYNDVKIPDGFDRIYIGTVTTDSLGIDSSNLQSVTRVGKVRIDELGNLDASAVILTAPNGNKYRVSVSDTGSLTTSPVS